MLPVLSIHVSPGAINDGCGDGQGSVKLLSAYICLLACLLACFRVIPVYTYMDYNTCSNIVDLLVQLRNIGYTPAHNHLDPIAWRSRILNTGADVWCNRILGDNRNF